MKFKRDYNMQNLMYTPRDRLFVVNWEKGGSMMTYMYFYSSKPRLAL